jgi:hypothetical protein
MSLDKPQPVDALSTSYESGLSPPPHEQVLLSLNVLTTVRRNDPFPLGSSDGRIDGCAAKRPLSTRFHFKPRLLSCAG